MSAPKSATAQNRRALQVTFGLTAVTFLVEVAGAKVTNSLALLADAGHVLTDVGGLGLALFATWMAAKPPTPSKTYGYYRVEILAALANALALFLIAFYILYEAYRRFLQPPEVASLPMLGVAAFGLLVNLVGIWNLRRGAKESLNVRGAFLEVVSDTLGSLGAILAAVIMLTTGWLYADPVISALIGLFILPRTWMLLSEAVSVLLEGAPPHLDVSKIEQAILQVRGIRGVHDLHAWTITSGIVALSAHVVLAEGIEVEEALRIVEMVSALLKKQFDVEHTTIQIERPTKEEQEMRL